jgi:hypothetical protein
MSSPVALPYKIEFSAQSFNGDPAVFIHIKYEPPSSAFYTTQVTSAQYTGTVPLIQQILAIDGVSAICSQAYRIWITRSSTYLWEDIIPQVLGVIVTTFGSTTSVELPGSHPLEGKPLPLVQESELRSLL